MVQNHKADSFDGRRAASIVPENNPVSMEELMRKDAPGTNIDPDDDDVRALLLAAMALTSGNE
ncbi:conserved protein of unknown function [Hyphomicrobium sp. 1Nfss2.1]|uniref:hypothetical protein n=1 Tax=Hyphomicrobium sp. 1Nfss2.1 TaxID=3413936 RepID=UPI003C7B9FA4